MVPNIPGTNTQATQVSGWYDPKAQSSRVKNNKQFASNNGLCPAVSSGQRSSFESVNYLLVRLWVRTRENMG